ncbi:hypothetical protein ACFVJM_35710 [Streptomyces virginiae]|uniref:hypothetical protein n=1 Tax=Streptomyces virginiae TaxID=1961 RepID=UPI00364111B6
MTTHQSPQPADTSPHEPDAPPDEHHSVTVAILDILIATESRRLLSQRGHVKQLCRDRRRAKRAAAARRCREYTRAGFFWSGAFALAVAMACFASGQAGAASQLLQFTMAAWIAALQSPPRR